MVITPSAEITKGCTNTLLGFPILYYYYYYYYYFSPLCKVSTFICLKQTIFPGHISVTAIR